MKWRHASEQAVKALALLALPGCIAPPPAGASPASTPAEPDIPCPEQPTPPKSMAGISPPCTFPKDADRFGMHFATVHLALCIDATGNRSSSHVIEDPGYGFADAALQCIANWRFQPGLDSSGHAAVSRFDVKLRYVR
jgi:hypothetical protein